MTNAGVDAYLYDDNIMSSNSRRNSSSTSSSSSSSSSYNTDSILLEYKNVIQNITKCLYVINNAYNAAIELDDLKRQFMISITFSTLQKESDGFNADINDDGNNGRNDASGDIRSNSYIRINKSIVEIVNDGIRAMVKLREQLLILTTLLQNKNGDNNIGVVVSDIDVNDDDHNEGYNNDNIIIIETVTSRLTTILNTNSKFLTSLYSSLLELSPILINYPTIKTDDIADDSDLIVDNNGDDNDLIVDNNGDYSDKYYYSVRISDILKYVEINTNQNVTTTSFASTNKNDMLNEDSVDSNKRMVETTALTEDTKEQKLLTFLLTSIEVSIFLIETLFKTVIPILSGKG